MQTQDWSCKHVLRSHWTGPNQTTDLKKPVSPWPIVLVRTFHCTMRLVTNFLTVATGFGFAMRPWYYNYKLLIVIYGLSNSTILMTSSDVQGYFIRCKAFKNVTSCTNVQQLNTAIDAISPIANFLVTAVKEEARSLNLLQILTITTAIVPLHSSHHLYSKLIT